MVHPPRTAACCISTTLTVNRHARSALDETTEDVSAFKVRPRMPVAIHRIPSTSATCILIDWATVSWMTELTAPPPYTHPHPYGSPSKVLPRSHLSFHADGNPYLRSAHRAQNFPSSFSHAPLAREFATLGVILQLSPIARPSPALCPNTAN